MHGTIIYVLAISGLLGLVSFLPTLAIRLRVPYTVLLAGVGAVVGCADLLSSITGDHGPFSDMLVALRELDVRSDTLLYVFLPVLLFETSLSVHVRRLLEDIGPILLLAVVAVLVSTFAVGAALWSVSPFPLTACLLLGAILATTDPAAVIGIFRDLGAPRRLSMLVEGESLLNDAAAIALFTLLLGMLTRGESGGVVDGAVGFLVAFLGGASVGFVLGRIACALVTPVHNQPLAEITLTVVLAYVSFLVADHYFKVSGVVAVVAAALVVGSVGRTRISPSSWGALEHVWRQLGFWANSLIFLLTATLVPRLLATVQWVDGLYLAVIVVAALAARAVVLFGMLPLLSVFNLGRRIDRAYSAVMLWGGLRGAVSLTLALAVTENGVLPEAVKGMVAVLVTGFVFFSLFVNGTTLQTLVRLLGLDRLSPVEAAMRQRALALSLAGIRERIIDVARRYEVDSGVDSGLTAQYGERIAELERERQQDAVLSDEERVAIGLVILTNRESELYYRNFREGIISRAVVEHLSGRTERMLDAVKQHGSSAYREAEEQFGSFSAHMRVASWLHRRLGIDGPLARRLAIRFEMLVAVRMVLVEQTRFARTKLAQMFGSGIAEELDRLIAERSAWTDRELDELKKQYPDYALVLQSQYLGRAALRMEAADYHAMHAESMISQEVLSTLERDIEQRDRALERLPRLDLKLDRMQLVSRVPMFAKVQEERRNEIAASLQPRLALPGELIVRKGDRGDAMFFIASGAVEVRIPGADQPVRLGEGDIFGEMALLTRQRRNADVRASGYCQLLVLEEKDFRRMVQRDAGLRAHVQEVAAARSGPPAAAVAVTNR